MAEKILGEEGKIKIDRTGSPTRECLPTHGRSSWKSNHNFMEKQAIYILFKIAAAQQFNLKKLVEQNDTQPA